MKRRVLWSREALDDIRDQIVFIARVNPSAARRIADRLRETGDNLGEMATGRPGRVMATYEKPVNGLPYIIAYELKEVAGREAVVILHVIHGARDWPSGEWPEQE